MYKKSSKYRQARILEEDLFFIIMIILFFFTALLSRQLQSLKGYYIDF